ncbi:hypothetical protein BJ875DRAFT_492527 [Amylocarpus encephaloides]|uniref:Uncharacterized protein n=1 Tax=Amylocarpus encephaloides TaxID=45428 RepID=A0A9P7YS10_9HELO|nr:hypothetical protein BJ875DRAFT_492527 [Amylocarpus encephaloides]
MCVLQPCELLADNDITAFDPSFKVVQYTKWWKKSSKKCESGVANDRHHKETISDELAGEKDAWEYQGMAIEDGDDEFDSDQLPDEEDPVISRWTTRPSRRFPSAWRAQTCNQDDAACRGCEDKRNSALGTNQLRSFPKRQRKVNKKKKKPTKAHKEKKNRYVKLKKKKKHTQANKNTTVDKMEIYIKVNKNNKQTKANMNTTVGKEMHPKVDKMVVYGRLILSRNVVHLAMRVSKVETMQEFRENRIQVENV